MLKKSAIAAIVAAFFAGSLIGISPAAAHTVYVAKSTVSKMIAAATAPLRRSDSLLGSRLRSVETSEAATALRVGSLAASLDTLRAGSDSADAETVLALDALRGDVHRVESSSSASVALLDEGLNEANERVTSLEARSTEQLEAANQLDERCLSLERDASFWPSEAPAPILKVRGGTVSNGYDYWASFRLEAASADLPGQLPQYSVVRAGNQTLMKVTGENVAGGVQWICGDDGTARMTSGWSSAEYTVEYWTQIYGRQLHGVEVVGVR